nr:Hsp70 family protein [Nakamurella aerolata]
MLSIDFGTSNTVVALAAPGQAPRTVTFDASPLLPSAVYVAADGSVTVGREAQRQARLDPTRYEPNPKRRIDDGEVLLGDRVVPVVDLIAAVLRTVATEVRRQLGGAAPDEVRLTHPAQWGATRQNTLMSAARAAGLGSNIALLPEPVAAAAQYTQLPGRELMPGNSVAVYDLGGGTFDIAVVGRTQNAFHVLAEAGLADLGGLDFDQAVLDHVGRTASVAQPARWQQILRPADASSRRAARALAEDVRAAKETLSRYPQTEVALPDPFSDVHLTRQEFEGLIRPNLMRSIEALQGTLRSAGVGADRLTGIFLVGGSSRIPLVAKLISDQLGVTPVALDQPETAVALGALLVPVYREGSRTVAFGAPPADAGAALASGRYPGNVAPQGFSSASSGAQPLGGPGGGGPGGSGGGTGGQPPVGPRSGALNGPHSGSVPATGGRTARQGRRSRTPLFVGSGAAALLLITALVLLIARPWAGSETAGGSGPASPPVSGAPGSTAPPSTPGSVTALGTVPGVGPGKKMTPAELNFLGPKGNRLTRCEDVTTPFVNGTSGYKVKRALQCQLSEADAEAGSLFDRIVVYVFTLDSPAGAGKLLDQMAKDRTRGQYAADDKSTTVDTSQGKLRIVDSDQLKPLGTSNNGDGVPAISWALDSQPYVGAIVAVTSGGSSSLYDFFQINYQPR